MNKDEDLQSRRCRKRISFLWKGEGVPRNVSDADRYFKMAADQGDAKAQLVVQMLSLYLL